MEVLDNKGVIYEFGKFVLDPEEKTLFENGRALHLPAKEFDTLRLLVENNGRAISKEEMMTSIWPDAVVEEGNLAKQISRLRKLLSSGGEEFIETLPKHGYRFSADVRRTMRSMDEPIIFEKRTVKRVAVEVEDGHDKVPLVLPPKTGRFSRKWLFAVAGVIILTGIAAILFWNRSAAPSDTKINTLAVLPIKPLSNEENNKQLAVGLTDALITKLGSLRPLIVRSASSVAQFTSGGYDPIEVGRKLDVNAVLEGAIMQADGRLRVNIRLLDTQTGEQIWEDRFDGAYTDLFDLEDRISEKAARNLLPRLTGETAERITKRFTENHEAFDAYLKGRYFWNKRSEDGFRRAIEYFNEAVAKDPNYALAYAGLADCYVLLGVWGTVPPNEAFPKARAAAENALRLDSELAEAVVSLAFIDWVHGWDFPKADALFKRAIDLNPNYALAHHWYSYYLVSMSRQDEAIAEIKKAKELEGPLSLSVNTDIGEIYSWAGRYNEADRYLQDVLRIEPNYAIAHNILGINLLKQNRVQEAIGELEKALALESAPRVLSVLGYAYAVSGDPAKAKEMLDELNRLSAKRYVSPFSSAIIHLGLGETDKAIANLESAYEERSDTMAILKAYPLLESLRSDQRFTQLEDRVGYPK